MKVITHMKVVYKQTGQASAILPTVTYKDRTAQSRKFDADDDDVGVYLLLEAR